ncbi:Predicted metal-dependent hydrolase, TIM-barrel fold [Variovorax sp. HW608]|uniref:amidohydrolase family protein n=1 Tax=Variovorax sp. HW608 TaxID=1034889 RepID=UPI00081FFB27|nr:amidohydrolase family protein [Variovorax sp. HW608]SCK16646.1 Predicted metal-dependent hydrolase, TIM-barrel fold [Variovorax sp. HW608]
MLDRDEEGVDIVDAHHHLWDLSQGRFPWLQEDYDPRAFFLGDYRSICRDFLPGDYRAAARGCRVVATIHVEAERARDEQVAETAWLQSIHAKHGFPNAIVAHAWFDRPDTEERLLQHLEYPLLRGIRSKPVTAPAPTQSVRGQPGTMQDDAWLRGFSLLARHGLSWDLRVPAWHLPEAAEVARMFPGVPIVLNHHGFAWDRSDEGLGRWRGWMEILAREPNVHVKLSEFGLRDQTWDWNANARIVRDTLAIFGWERCMFASNFPVAGLRIAYPELVNGMLQTLSADLSPSQRQAVMSGNALRFYRIDLPPGIANLAGGDEA